MICKHIEGDKIRFWPVNQQENSLLSTVTAKIGARRGADGSVTIPGFKVEHLPAEVRQWIPRTERFGNPLNMVLAPRTKKPFPFQAEDIIRMVEPGGWGEWAACGCGKTLISVWAYWILKQLGKVDGMIVIGPEVGRHAWCGDESLVAEYIGTENAGHWVARNKQTPTSGILYMTGAKCFREPYCSEITRLVQSRRWILVTDECQEFTGPNSKRVQFINLWADWCLWRWALSATPQNNYPDTSWAIYRYLTRSDVTLQEWNDWFGGTHGRWNKHRLAQYGRHQQGFSQVREKADVAPWLPPVTSRVIRVPLEGRQEELYGQVCLEGKAAWEARTIQAHDVWTRLVHLQSIASHPLVAQEQAYGEISKLRYLKELLFGIGTQKTCIWSWHPAVLDWLFGILNREVPGSCVRYHGQVPKSEKDVAAHRFNHDPEVQFFLGNPSSAGMSLNLPAGSVRIYWDMHWEWVDLHQSRERIERMEVDAGGNPIVPLPITEFILVGAGTVEEMMLEAVEKKQNFQRLVFGQDEKAIWKSPLVGSVFERWKKRV